jgi:hypothetical protein
MFTNKKIFSNACKLVLFAVFLSLFTSCSEWDNSYDFRNYLRDKHLTVSGLAKWLNPKLNRITKL